VPIVADAAVAVRGDLTKFNQDLKGADKQVQGFGARFRSALSPGNLLAAGGIAFGASQLVGVLNDAAAAASDLEQAQAKANVVFGDGVDDINAWAEQSAEGFLMSKRAALEAAGTYGNLFQAFGIARPAATEMSQTLVELAADLASFNNSTVDEALLALRSGLSGETEPLKRYGVALSQARMEEVALAEGIWDGVGAMDAAEKAQAAYALILQDTALAQGDVARSAGQLAVEQMRAAAKIENGMAEDGRMWASIQLGAIKTFEALQSDPFEGLARHFGDQAIEIDRAAQSVGVSAEEMREAVNTAMNETGASFEEAVESATGSFAELQAGAFYTYSQVATAAAEGMASARETTQTEAEAIATIVPDEIARRWEDTRRAAFQTVVEQAKGILDAQNQVKVAFEVLTQLQVEEQTRGQRIAYLQGVLSSQHLADGLNDGRPGVRQAARAVQAEVLAELAGLGVDAYGSGYNIGASLAAGLNASTGVVKDAAGNVAAAATGQLQIRSEPPDADSPLRGITQWGGNIAKTIADGMVSGTGYAASAASALASALSPNVGAYGSPEMAGAGAGGPTFILSVEGKERTLNSMTDLWGAYDSMGSFSDRSMTR
jgi:hypothetical protein